MVSVIIPTHNRCDLLPRAIRSVQAQTYRDIEIIVVSDGSTDDTGAIVASAAQADPRIRFLEHHPARGGNYTRNEGIRAATGEYVAFLDDDDEWMPEKLEKQLAVIDADPSVGLVYTGVRIIFTEEKVSYASRTHEHGDLSQRILLNNCIGTTSTVLVKKELLDQTGGFDPELKALQDYDLWIRICQLTRVGAVPEEMIRYYNYPGTGQISAVTQKYIDSRQYINGKYPELFGRLTEQQLQRKQLNDWFLLADKALRNGEGKAARKYAARSLKTKLTGKGFAFIAMSFFSYKTVLKLRSRI